MEGHQITEVPRTTIKFSVRSKEWAADENFVESEFESSRVDLMMMSDGSHSK